MVLGYHPLRLGYVVLFVATAVVCFGAIARARARIDDHETRWGLAALLATSGLWATFHVGRLLAPSEGLKTVFYALGLTVGLSTVGAWLYFCSAYAGETYHRQPSVRWAAVALYAGIVALKLTNPLHGFYFSATMVETPFRHLAVDLGALHWVVTGLAYALSGVGFYILFALFERSEHATRRLGVLVGLAGAPVVLDLLGYLNPGVVIKLNYEPVGVAVFAVGVLYLADGSLVAVRQFGRERLVDELDEGVVILDEDGVVRDVNAQALALFPGLEDAVGDPVESAAPDVAAYLPLEGPTVLTRDEFDPPRHYLLSSTPLTAGQTSIGRALVFTDITTLEHQRRELEQRQTQLDHLAEAITHELRNTVNIVQGHLRLAESRLDGGTDATAGSVQKATAATDRMTDILRELTTLTRLGQTVEETDPVDAEATARRAWALVGGGEAELTVVDVDTVEAEAGRLERLFENLFRFSLYNGATRVRVERDDGRLIVTDDGPPVSETDLPGLLEYGEAVPDAESGMLLPIARTLAAAHGWTLRVDTSYRDGVRVVVETE